MNNTGFIALLGTLLLSGCAAGPESAFSAPAVTYPIHWQDERRTEAPFRWDDFHDAQLTGWLAQVDQRNADLALASLRLFGAQLEAQRTGRNRYPDVSASVSSQGSRPLDQAGEGWQRQGNAQLGIRYEVDLWGKLARQRDAAQWQQEASAQDLAAARLKLQADASNNYWQIAWLNQRIAVSEQSIDWSQQTLRLVSARHAAGSVAELDVINARESLAEQQSALETLKQQRQVARNERAVLLNSPPGTPAPERSQLPQGMLPAIPADIPAAILAKRPDLRAAEQRLRASLAQVDQQRAEFYPSLSLTGTLGSSSAALLALLQNPLATLGASVTLPFVQWQQKQLQVDLARNQYQQHQVRFQQALYRAMAEVEDTLSERSQLRNQELQLAAARDLAVRSEQINQIRYQSGATAITFWLDAQEKRRQAQMALDNNRYQQLRNLSRIWLAMGGDA